MERHPPQHNKTCMCSLPAALHGILQQATQHPQGSWIPLQRVILMLCHHASVHVLLTGCACVCRPARARYGAERVGGSVASCPRKPAVCAARQVSHAAFCARRCSSCRKAGEAPGCLRKKKKCSATVRWRFASLPSAPGGPAASACLAASGCRAACAGLLAPTLGSFTIGDFCVYYNGSHSASLLGFVA